MKKIFKITAIAAVCSFVAVPVWADDEEDVEQSLGTTVLEPIVVTEQNRSLRTEHKEKYTASAMSTTTGLALTPKETPQSVSAITRTQLDDLGVTDMDDALRYTTGVNVVRENRRFRYQSRGFYINRIEEDGLSTSVLLATGGNLLRDSQSMTNLAIYDHIEVVRGATGLTQGQGQPGGTINAVRKKPTHELQFIGDVSIDRFGELVAMADVSGSLNAAQTLRGRLVGSFERIDTFQDDDKGTNGLIYGVGEYDLGENSKLTLGGLYQRIDEKPDYWGLPAAADLGPDPGLPRDTYLGFDWSDDEREKGNVFGEVEHWFNDDWKAGLKFSYIKSKSDSIYAAIAGSGSGTAPGFSGQELGITSFNKYKNESEQLVINANLTGKFHLFERGHDVFLGYTWSYEDANAYMRQFNRLPDGTVLSGITFDPFTFTGNEMSEPDWSNPQHRIHYKSIITMHGVMFGSRFNPFDSLHIIGGTRWTRWRKYDLFDYDIWNYAPDSDPDDPDTLERSRFVPYLGITFDITPSQSLYASYTSIFEPQSRQDYYDRYLDPILGNNYEIGWKGEWFNRALNTSLALFQIEQENRAIQVLANNHDGSRTSYYEPIGEVRSRGLEAEISGNLTDNWKIFGGYTFNETKYMKTEGVRYQEGMSFSKHTPKHMLRLYTNYTLPWFDERLTIGGGLNWQSDVESAWGVRQGSYAVWNANIQYDVTDNLKISLIGKNIFDKRYFLTTNNRNGGMNGFFGEPFNLMLKVSWKL